MLETVRENLKGTLMIIVVIIFIVPMVISGVGTTFLGSVAGTDAATVNGEVVTNIELDRAIRLRRSQIMAQQGANASAEFLTDELLRAPVLEQLTRRLAVVSEGEKAGMGLSDAQFAQAVRDQEAFFSDGKFNQQKYNSLLAQNGLTSASFREEVKSDLILRQQALGLHLSSFATATQVEQLVKLTHQKRSFFSTTIPLSLVEASVEISESDLTSYYDANQTEFEVPEKVKVDYLELSVDKLAKSMEVSDTEIQHQYDAEVANFVSDATYEVAHILLEGEDSAKAEELANKITAGEDFSMLAKEYSDDIASSEDGGKLGVLTPGMFPKEFEDAVYSLEAGEVSDAVKTDAGIHFIKVTNKTENEVPSLESRREDIAQDIANARAADEFAALVDTLGELTYFSEDLNEAAAQLGLSIQHSAYFDRNSGSGIADSAKVREAAFDEKVLTLGNNSNSIEINGEQVVVLRLAERKPAYVKKLEEVLPLVEAKVKQSKVTDKLESLSAEFIAAIQEGGDAKLLSEQKGYSYDEHELAKRNDFDIDRQTIGLAFEAAIPSSAVSFQSKVTPAGNYLIVGVSDVKDGSLADLDEAESESFQAQIAQELAAFDSESYESLLVEVAKVNLR